MQVELFIILLTITPTIYYNEIVLKAFNKLELK